VLYYLVKVLVNIFHRVYYKYEVKGKHYVPYNQPVILAPNHTNAFIDPIAPSMCLRQKVRFFARGDVFKGKLAKWTLNALNVSPMYRIQEGYSELKKNDKTFEECKNLLSANKTILLFPEAICIQEKRLQPLKKGLSRILFQTEEAVDFKKNVLVVPVGLNYSDAKKFRSKLFVNFGEPISIKKFEDRFKQDKVKTINEFTKYLEQEMAKLIIVIDNSGNDVLVKLLTEIYLATWMKDKKYDVKSLEKQYEASKEIAEMINYYDVHQPHLIESLKNKIISYTKNLNKLELRDHLLSAESINKMNVGRFLIDFFIMWFGLPIYFIGLVVNYPPYYISKKFTDAKIKKAEFYASIYANMAMLLWVIYYGLQVLCIGLLFHSWSLLALYAVIAPVLGCFVLSYYPVMKKILGRWNLIQLVRKEKATVEKLMAERTQLMEEIQLMKEAHFKHFKVI
jgi:glycerol-3-phosphate O-acyltransferase/dihydroxyacetone phosphate acyltransferase